MAKNRNKTIVVDYCVGWSFDGLIYAKHYIDNSNNELIKHSPR